MSQAAVAHWLHPPCVVVECLQLCKAALQQSLVMSLEADEHRMLVCFPCTMASHSYVETNQGQTFSVQPFRQSMLAYQAALAALLAVCATTWVLASCETGR